jgi:hypothetical protein
MKTRRFQGSEKTDEKAGGIGIYIDKDGSDLKTVI